MSSSAQVFQEITDCIGAIPYRLALAGGWIDQPFVSMHHPCPPGSMVVVGIKPTFMFMERAGMATGTRKVALRHWGESLPSGEKMSLVKELYAEENRNQEAPSGSQDMVGLIYPGVNRLDFDYKYEGGIFPYQIESNNDPEIANWLEKVIHVVPIAPRPAGYSPLGEQHITPSVVQRLGQSGKDCFDAIVTRNIQALGRSMNDCMECWEQMMPHTVRHSTIDLDLMKILRYYQANYAGAMYSGCGGGYIYVISEESVPGGISVQVN